MGAYTLTRLESRIGAGEEKSMGRQQVNRSTSDSSAEVHDGLATIPADYRMYPVITSYAQPDSGKPDYPLSSLRRPTPRDPGNNPERESSTTGHRSCNQRSVPHPLRTLYHGATTCGLSLRGVAQESGKRANQKIQKMVIFLRRPWSKNP